MLETPSQGSAVGTPSAAKLRRRRALGVGLAGLGVGLAVNSLLGPFVLDVVDYPVSETMWNQTIGLDAANLLLVAPAAVLVGLLVLRGRPLGSVLGIGIGAYTAYMFVQYLAGPDYLEYPGTLLLQLALFCGGWALAALAWREAPVPEPLDTGASRRHAYGAWLLAAFVLARYIPGLVGSLTGEPLAPEVAADPAMYWLIFLMDVGVFVPVAIGTGVALRRGSEPARRVLQAAVVWFVLTSAAVGAMAVAMLTNDDPNASMGQLVLFVVVGAAAAAYAYRLHRPLLERSPEPMP